MVNKEVYDIPRSFVEKFDRQRLLLRITKDKSESLQDKGKWHEQNEKIQTTINL
jgi:hypothetical protein